MFRNRPLRHHPKSAKSANLCQDSWNRNSNKM